MLRLNHLWFIYPKRRIFRRRLLLVAPTSYFVEEIRARCRNSSSCSNARMLAATIVNDDEIRAEVTR